LTLVSAPLRRLTGFWHGCWRIAGAAVAVPCDSAVFGAWMGAGLRQVAPDRFASHFGELLGHIFVPGPVITYDRSQPGTKAGFGPGQGGVVDDGHGGKPRGRR
jgi:hypothetical protein